MPAISRVVFKERTMKGMNTYLTFEGNCREAMTFYEKCLEAELSIMPFSAGEGHCDFPP